MNCSGFNPFVFSCSLFITLVSLLKACTVITMILMLSLIAKSLSISKFFDLYSELLKITLSYNSLKCSVIISMDLTIPSFIATDGTTIINFVNPYCLFNSNIVLKNTYVLPVPVSISISKSYSPGFIILDGGNPFFN